MATEFYWLFQRSGRHIVSFIICILLLTIQILPLSWSGNEINYFDLAYQQVRPDLYGPGHAVFDSSRSRFLSFWIIGSVIDAVGFEPAKTILALLCIALYAGALTGLAIALGLGPAAIAVTLNVYFVKQSLLGGEWLFGTVEPKLFAYILVIAGIASAVSGRWSASVVLMALGTAFHFLVGGFWGAAVLVLHRLSRNHWRATLLLLTLFAMLVSPIVALLVQDRVGVGADMTGLDRSLAEIYSAYRASHHVAPFEHGMHKFALSWFPGLLAHFGLALAFFVMRRDFGPQSAFALWVAGLNAFILVAVAVAFLDRHTHLVAPLYIFRPSALILLLSVLLLVWRVVLALDTALQRSPVMPTALLVAAFVLLTVVLNAARLAFTAKIDQRLAVSIRGPELGVLDWLLENTGPGYLILVQPSSGDGSLDEGNAFPGGLERLTRASFYVNYKFVPTSPADVAEWYRRLQQRRAIFEGDCARLAAIEPTFLIMRSGTNATPLEKCTEIVYRNDSYLILRPNVGSRGGPYR